MTDPSRTRRSLLRSGLLAGAAVLTGCNDNQAGSSTDGEPEPPSNSVFRDVSVDGKHLVVQLQEGHSVSGLNLIGPDGSLFTQTDIATGETAKRLQLIDLKPMISGSKHYGPGTHELTAANGNNSIEFTLEPDLQITKLEQYRAGGNSGDFGRLAVTIRNNGSGPTWIHDISYREAPNEDVNDPVSEDPGTQTVFKPEEPSELILEPDAQRTFVGDTTPLLLNDESSQTCEGGQKFTVLIGIGWGPTLEAQVSATLDGEVRTVGLTGQYTCDSISLELVESISEDTKSLLMEE